MHEPACASDHRRLRLLEAEICGDPSREGADRQFIGARDAAWMPTAPEWLGEDANDDQSAQHKEEAVQASAQA